jgi:hypothetical protein
MPKTVEDLAEPTQASCVTCRARFYPLIETQMCCGRLCAEKRGRLDEIKAVRAELERRVNKAMNEGLT